ncbi:MAG TPA: FliI/YscN family ATPase [Phycisphaerae bacterium]|nr:FliI/YscN family ATPase [Phycisphaerae bacterium]
MTRLNLGKYHERLERIRPLGCKGSVVRVAGLAVESKGPPVGTGQLCDIHLADGRHVPAEVVGFHKANRILLPLEGIAGIAPNDAVTVRSAPRYLRLGESILGRVVDGLGRPIDGKGPLTGQESRALDQPPIEPMSRKRITEPLSFGLRAFDAMLTCGKGQRMGIFAGSGVGKSLLLGEIARASEADVNVLALVGERGREVREFLDEALGPEGLARSVVAVATSDTSPIQRVKVAFLAITIAEYFRDQGRHVLLMMDSLTRFAQAQREIGLAAGEPPTTKGYCPSVFSLLPRLTERLGCTERGSVTGMFTVLVEADDMTDPVADSARSLLDGHVILSRKLAEMGHYPAVDILQSVSRLMPHVTSAAQQAAAQKLRTIYATYQGAEDLINIGALVAGSNRHIDRAVSLIDQVRDFLIQPLGERSSFPETLRRMQEITDKWDFLLPEETPKPSGVQT